MKKQKESLNLRREAYKKMEQMHQHQLMLYVAMTGSGIIFLFMIVAFAVSRPEEAEFVRQQFPKSFVISTMVLLISSFSVSKVVPAYEKDDMDELKKWMGITFLLGLVFAASQVTGWKELQENSIFFAGVESGAYLYVISGLHVLHMAVVMVFLLSLLMQCHKVSKDVVKQLVYSTTPYQKVKLKILVDFWHFIDLLWIVLFLYFLFTF